LIQLLTRYLLQYRKLAVPHVGTFALQQQPPEFNVVDKLLSPPRYRLLWEEEPSPSPHQLRCLADMQGLPLSQASDSLEQFGHAFRRRLEAEPFHWNGVAVLRREGRQVVVEQHLLALPGLEAVPALKVLRENVSHTVLVGDRELSRQAGVPTEADAASRSTVVLVGWILLVLTLLAIGFLLYQRGFAVQAGGY
jgi:hypothetical protein